MLNFVIPLRRDTLNVFYCRKFFFPIFAGPLMTEPTNKIYEQDPHSRVPQLSQYAGPQRRHPL